MGQEAGLGASVLRRPRFASGVEFGSPSCQAKAGANVTALPTPAPRILQLASRGGGLREEARPGTSFAELSTAVAPAPGGPSGPQQSYVCTDTRGVVIACVTHQNLAHLFPSH